MHALDAHRSADGDEQGAPAESHRLRRLARSHRDARRCGARPIRSRGRPKAESRAVGDDSPGVVQGTDTLESVRSLVPIGAVAALVSLLTCAAGIVAACDSASPGAQRAWAPGDPGVVVFEGEDGGLYAMRPDGKSLRPFVLGRPCVPLDFSRDGRVVACAGSWPGIEHIYVMNRDGSNRRRVPLPPGAEVADASLSPDGRQLAFTNARAADSFEIWRVSKSGTGARRLVVGGVNQRPRWSPDGRRIVYVREARVTACAAGDAVVMDTNGRHRRVVARNITVAKWSPDERRIGFVDDCGTITTAPVAGGVARVVARRAYEPDFAWSPSGLNIAFARQQDPCPYGVRRGLAGAPPECARVRVVSATGGPPRPVGPIATTGTAPFWLPSSAARASATLAPPADAGTMPQQ
jgi:WD40-like Beta Propeller Repeat